MQDYGPIRLLLAVLAAAFAYCLGHALGARRRGGVTLGGLYRWALRTTAAAMAVLVTGGLDTIAGIMLASAAGLTGLGFLRGRQPPKPPEDLSKLLFPKQ